MTPADLGARARLDAAFALEERRGLMLAAAARSVAVVLIIGWITLVNPEQGLAYGWIVAPPRCSCSPVSPSSCSTAAASAPRACRTCSSLVDSLALAAVLTVPNPFAPVVMPAPLPLRFANFLYFFVFLMQMTFSFRPTAAAVDRCLRRRRLDPGLPVGAQPARRRHQSRRPARRHAATLTAYFNPNYVSVLKYRTRSSCSC